MADVVCPRCRGSGKSAWRQPGGQCVPVRCGLCGGKGECDERRAKPEMFLAVEEKPKESDQ